MKFRKKPVIIEAFQWTGDYNQEDDPVWIIEAMRQGNVRIETNPLRMFIDTLEGTHQANPRDFIIQGIKGELYPCKPDIFEATYEKAEE